MLLSDNRNRKLSIGVGKLRNLRPFRLREKIATVMEWQSMPRYINTELVEEVECQVVLLEPEI